jgi:hypothetical protein|tara:strand:- start:4091 stop:4639 length:549 start_codon:yes stop_codon:yes gene_type:complete
MVTTKATFQGAQFENVSRNLEFFILTTVIDITDTAGDTSTAKKLGQAQNLNKFLQTIMLRCNPIIMSIAKTTGAAVPTHDGTNNIFGSGWSGSDLTYWTMKFSTDYPKAYAGTAISLATGQTQTKANEVFHLSNDFKGIAIDIGLDESGGGYTWSASNDFINTTESASAVNRNTYITRTDIL